MLFAYAETPLHHGGSASQGLIDLPVQREAATRLPTIWGQSAKGALRQHARALPTVWPDAIDVFGSEPPGSGNGDAGDSKLAAGWLAVGDFRLVAFPVPTLDHVFVWATSPLLLARLTRVVRLAGIGGLPAVPAVRMGAAAHAGAWPRGTMNAAVADYDIALDEGAGNDLTVAWAGWLADNALPALPSGQQTDEFEYFRRHLRSNLVVVDDEQMKAFTEECAEVVARVQLEPGTKAVAQGPWYTEYVPAETIMVSLIRSTGPDLGVLQDRLANELLVAGGDETVGKGLMWLRWR